MQEINETLFKSVTRLATLFIPIIFIHFIHSTTAAAKECDFEIYGRQGCYSQANFVCDLETNLCKCLPETPILIDGRICVQKVKANGVCKYSEQCDNASGFYCTYSYYSYYKLVNNSESSNSPLHRQTNARCRLYNIKYNKHNGSSKYSSSHSSSSSSSPQQHQQHEKSRSSPGMSNFQACVWAFLVACLFLLIILLLHYFIKSHYQEIREFRPPFQQAEDRLSVHSEIDVPPPYEVAIRMKS